MSDYLLFICVMTASRSAIASRISTYAEENTGTPAYNLPSRHVIFNVFADQDWAIYDRLLDGVNERRNACEGRTVNCEEHGVCARRTDGAAWRGLDPGTVETDEEKGGKLYKSVLKYDLY